MDKQKLTPELTYFNYVIGLFLSLKLHKQFEMACFGKSFLLTWNYV